MLIHPLNCVMALLVIFSSPSCRVRALIPEGPDADGEREMWSAVG